MPKNGSTSGTNRYPMPNHDQTVGCANSSGSTRLSVPMTSTPTSSKQIATQAVRYQPLVPANTSASVAMM